MLLVHGNHTRTVLSYLKAAGGDTVADIVTICGRSVVIICPSEKTGVGMVPS